MRFDRPEREEDVWAESRCFLWDGGSPGLAAGRESGSLAGWNGWGGIDTGRGRAGTGRGAASGKPDSVTELGGAADSASSGTRFSAPAIEK